jgi:hypothetical protein
VHGVDHKDDRRVHLSTSGAIMKYAIIIAALLLTGCHEFKCIDGKVYRNLDGDTWIESGLWVGTRCTTIEVKK